MGKHADRRPRIEVSCPAQLQAEFERIVVSPKGLSLPEVIRALMLNEIRLEKQLVVAYNGNGNKK